MGNRLNGFRGEFRNRRHTWLKPGVNETQASEYCHCSFQAKLVLETQDKKTSFKYHWVALASVHIGHETPFSSSVRPIASPGLSLLSVRQRPNEF